MPRSNVRRAKAAPRLEMFEPRTLLSLGSAAGPVPWTPPRADASDSILIRFAATVPAPAVAADLNAVGGHVVQQFPSGPTWVVLDPGVDRDAALRRLQADPGVVYAEADASFHVNSIVPNDPNFGQQWGLNNGDNVDIDAPEAWGVTIGSSATVVAVLDTGIDVWNPDLAGRLWTNPNPWRDPGFYGDVHGWNFVNNTPNIQDDDGHGTHVSGVIAAWSNNGVGVAGIDWNARIMPVKVLDASGNGTTDAAVAGIYFAVNHGARVINASWGGGAYSQAMIDALNYANSRGVVFVTAAGNGGTNNDAIPSYPASYRLPNEIAVAAVDPWGNLASFSNYGPNTVDLAAPGVNILSTVPGGYAAISGTSMATPYVTGVVSLLLGLHPDWSAPQLVHQVLATAKPLPGLAGRVATGGMVDAFNAVANLITGAGNPVGGGEISVPGDLSSLQPGASADGDVLAGILASDAFYLQEGGTNAGFVAGIFQVVLGRTPDPSGFNYFTGQLASGVSRFTVAQELINTPEGREAQVARWYQVYFHDPRPFGQLEQDPGVQFWSGVVAGYGQNTALAGILSTDAFWYGNGANTGGFLNGTSWVVFGRPVDVNAYWYFNTMLASGTSRFDVVRILQGTPEAKAALVASWYQQVFGWQSPLWQIEANPLIGNWVTFLGNY